MNDVTPRVDIAFKKLFGVEENKDLLISLINSIVSKEDQVVDLTLLNPYSPQNFRFDKLSILDIKAMGADGKRFNIEIQISDEADYDKRALYYWAKLYTEQLKTKQDYSNLSKAIGIHILNFISILDSDEYHNVFCIKEKKTNFEYFKDLELHTIELKKFTDINEQPIDRNRTNFSDSKSEQIAFISKIKTSLDMWVAFLTRYDLLNKGSIPKTLGGDSLDKALSVIEIMNFTYEEREAYEGQLKWFMIETNTLKKAENKGLEAGLEAGLQQGLQQGLEKGREEALKETAINMLKEKLNESLISQITGLSLEKIMILKAKL